MPLHLLPLGGGHHIGGSCLLLEMGRRRLLVDAGAELTGTFPPPWESILHQRGIEGWDWIGALALTHAHLDHSGALPWLLRRAPHLPVVCAAPTLELMMPLLEHVARRNRWYDLKDVEEVQYRIQAYDGELKIGETWLPFAPLEHTIRASFLPAGHVLGAASLFVETPEGNVFFTSDFSVSDQRTVEGVAGSRLWDEVASQGIDVLVLEATYGKRLPELEEEPLEGRLLRLTREVVEQGVVLIPAFALGRSAEILAIFQEAIEEGNFPKDVPVYYDGLAAAFARLYQRHVPGFLHGVPFFTPQGFELAGFGRDDWIGFVADRPGVVVASSGMLLEDSASAHYARRLLTEERNACLLTGYTPAQTPAGRLWSSVVQGEKPAWLPLGEIPIPVQAQVDRAHFSAHANCAELIAQVERLRPQQVILVHVGDGDAEEDFPLLEALQTRGYPVRVAHDGKRIRLA
ncbi:MAG: MBL fold metallo-hydrolase [candidate division WOR-3 bacterium]